MKWLDFIWRSRHAAPEEIHGIPEPVDWTHRTPYNKDGPIEQPIDYEGSTQVDSNGLKIDGTPFLKDSPKERERVNVEYPPFASDPCIKCGAVSRTCSYRFKYIGDPKDVAYIWELNHEVKEREGPIHIHPERLQWRCVHCGWEWCTLCKDAKP